MGKKKKKKKNKAKAQQLQKLSFVELMEKGKLALANQKARNAISFFRNALKKKKTNADEVKMYLYQAYRIREKQLREKKMTVEADNVAAMALANMPPVDMIPQEELLKMIVSTRYSEALGLYISYLKRHSPVKEIDHFIAGQAMVNGSLESLIDGLKQLPTSVLLKQQAIDVTPAIRLMDEAKWEGALAQMGRVSRSSPFAEARLFCRAMVAFYNDDQTIINKATRMISDNFALKPVADALRVENPSEIPIQSHLKKIASKLWTGPFELERKIEELIHHIKRRKLSRMKHYIQTIASIIYPDKPTLVVQYIMEMLSNTIYENFPEHRYNSLVDNILPKPQADLVYAKNNLKSSPDLLESAGEYLMLAKQDFPDADEEKIAHALVLSNLVGRIVKYRINLSEELHCKELDPYRELLGIEIDNAQIVPIDMLTKAIHLDPDYKPYYEQMAKLLRQTREAKNKVEKVLLSMKDRFRNDPYPCIELSTIYYEKNAYRKAETVLNEALKRAPHDNRVIEQHVISLLIAASRSHKLRNMNLVWRDMEKAKHIQTKRVAWLVTEKQLLFKLFENTVSAKTLVKETIEVFPLDEQLKIMAVLVLDMDSRSVESSKFYSTVKTLFKKGLNRVDSLNSKEIMSLLLPLPDNYRSLLPTTRLVTIFLKYRKKLINRLTNQDLLSLVNVVLGQDVVNFLQKTLKKRVKTLKEPLKTIYQFYIAFIEYFTTNSLDFQLVQRLLDDADTKTRQDLCQASRYLAKYAKGSVQTAMERCDFDIMRHVFDDDDYDDEYYDDDFDDDLDLLPEMMPSMIIELVNEFEDMIDDEGLRGASKRELKRFSFQNSMNPKAQIVVRIMKDCYDQGILTKISKEAKAILFNEF